VKQQRRGAVARGALRYQYNGHGDLVAINKAAGPHDSGASVGVTPVLYNFEYDYLHQLTHATGESPSSTTQRSRFVLDQQYDEIGNIMLKDQSSFSETQNQSGAWVSTPVPNQTYRNTYTYGGTQPHAPSRIATQGGLTIDYQYDASGNHIQRTSVAGTRNATWTDDDKLRSMKRAADSYDLIRNYYDGQGNKAIAVHPGATSTEEVAFHRGDLTIRVNGDNQYVTKHIYAGSERIASKMDAAWFTSSPIQYYVSDHLGSAHYTLDGHQNLLSHTEFFPSGELWIDQLNQNYTQTPRWSFTGKEWDADTGLYDFGARQYDPRVGQWLSPDPILASYMQGGPNGGVYYPINLGLYSYVANNPVKYVDENGEFFWMPVIIGGAVGAAVGAFGAMADPARSSRSVFAGFLGGAVTGALAGVPFTGPAVAGAGSLAAYNALVVAPIGWAISAVGDPGGASLGSLGASMALAGVGGPLAGRAASALGNAVFRSHIPDAVLRNGVLSRSGDLADYGHALRNSYFAEQVVEGGVNAAATAGLIAGGDAAHRASSGASSGAGAPVSGTGGPAAGEGANGGGKRGPSGPEIGPAYSSGAPENSQRRYSDRWGRYAD
jgi:RHS repeat-associated protein